MQIETINVEQLRLGDAFVHDGKVIWVAAEDAYGVERHGRDVIHCRVTIVADGGGSSREWDAGHKLAIRQRDADATPFATHAAQLGVTSADEIVRMRSELEELCEMDLTDLSDVSVVINHRVKFKPDPADAA